MSEEEYRAALALTYKLSVEKGLLSITERYNPDVLVAPAWT
jgi:hypothetical protein